MRCKYNFSRFFFKHCRIGFLFILIFLFAKINAQQKHEDFSQKYTGMGALSELIMSHKCIIRNNFNLFFESSIKKTENDRTLVWYKLVFHQSCFVSFTIIPNSEADRYGLEIFKIKNNVKICNTKLDSVFTKLDSIGKDVIYNDNFQSASFRGSLFNTRLIQVSFDEVVYILVNNLSGPDLGHVIDLQTCDYSYVLKANKEAITEDTDNKLAGLRKGYNAPIDRLNSLAIKLCSNSNDVKMGYSNFLGAQMGTKNLNATQVDSAAKVQANTIRTLDSLAGRPLSQIATDDSPTASLSSTEKNDSLKSLEFSKAIDKPDTTRFNESKEPKAIGKTDSTNAGLSVQPKKYIPLIFYEDSLALDSGKAVGAPRYSVFYLKDSIFEIVNQRSLSNDHRSSGIGKKTKSLKKVIDVTFSVVNATTKKVISKPGLKLFRKSNSKTDLLVYHDSISSYSSEFLNSGKWQLKCDLFGYLPYEEQLDNSKCITVDDEMYYVILLIPLKKGDKLVLPNVFFHPNSTVLKQNSFVELNKLVDYLNTNPVKISINGHTQGNNKINNTVNAIPMEYQFKGSASKLSKKRAEVVFNYLVQKGIASERLTVKGYAGRKPIIKHPKNRKEREINMRVEIKIVDINTTYLK